MARSKRTTRRRTTRTSTRRTRATYKRRSHRTTRRRTRGQYDIPSSFVCDGQRGPATTVMTTNAAYGTASYNPYGPGGPSMRTTNAVYGFNNQVVDDNKSSGLALGPQPFRMR